MTTHELKCWPEPFQALKSGAKTAEFRKNDRGYQVGDTLHVREWMPHPPVAPGEGYLCVEVYTGDALDLLVTHIIEGPALGIQEGYCMMSVQRADTITLPVEVRSWETFDKKTVFSVGLVPAIRGSITLAGGNSIQEAKTTLRDMFVKAYRQYMDLPDNPIDDSQPVAPCPPEGGR